MAAYAREYRLANLVKGMHRLTTDEIGLLIEACETEIEAREEFHRAASEYQAEYDQRNPSKVYGFAQDPNHPSWDIAY